jgi:DNA-binding TFAR19-related protein (PDSD5 family)
MTKYVGGYKNVENYFLHLNNFSNVERKLKKQTLGDILSS